MKHGSMQFHPGTSPQHRAEMARSFEQLRQELEAAHTAEQLAERLESSGFALGPLAAWVRAHQDLVIGALLDVVLFALMVVYSRNSGLTAEELDELLEKRLDSPLEVVVVPKDPEEAVPKPERPGDPQAQPKRGGRDGEPNGPQHEDESHKKQGPRSP